jgi:hypothetical protein
VSEQDDAGGTLDDAGISPEGGTTTDVAEPACQDDLGTPGACNPMAGDAGCSALESVCVRRRDLLKPGVATKLIACMQGLSECTEQRANLCMKVALFDACDDPSAETVCSEVITTCAGAVPLTMMECHNFLDGMTDQARLQVASCLKGADGGAPCASGVWGCIISL